MVLVFVKCSSIDIRAWNKRGHAIEIQRSRLVLFHYSYHVGLLPFTKLAEVCSEENVCID